MAGAGFSAADITALVAVELIAVTALVVAAIGFDFLAPLILDSRMENIAAARRIRRGTLFRRHRL